MKIDWKDAPKGTTHCLSNNLWYKIQDNEVYCIRVGSSGWNFSSYEMSNLTPANGFTPRPVDGMWDTTKLPPVGTVCEVWEREEWHKCEIVAHVKSTYILDAIYQLANDWGGSAQVENFRPIQNDRDKAIEEMVAIYYKHSEGSSSVRFGALYDAGYKKP